MAASSAVVKLGELEINVSKLREHRGVIGILGNNKVTLEVVHAIVKGFNRGFCLIDNTELAEHWKSLTVDKCITPRSHDPIKIISNLFEIQRYRQLEQISDAKRLGIDADDETKTYGPAYVVLDMTSPAVLALSSTDKHFTDQQDLMSKAKAHDCLCIVMMHSSQLPASFVDYWLFPDLSMFTNSIESQQQLIRWAFHANYTQEQLNSLTETMNDVLQNHPDTVLLANVQERFRISKVCLTNGCGLLQSSNDCGQLLQSSNDKSKESHGDVKHSLDSRGTNNTTDTIDGIETKEKESKESKLPFDKDSKLPFDKLSCDEEDIDAAWLDLLDEEPHHIDGPSQHETSKTIEIQHKAKQSRSWFYGWGCCTRKAKTT